MGSVRISGGALRGRNVPLPRGEVRPTSARAREAYFNVIAPRIDGARFLDLFSGTGVFSLEAASRGAAAVVSIDNSPRAMRALGELARAWELPIRTITADALAAVPRLRNEPPFDLVYVDPPYDYPDYAPLLRAVDLDLPLSDDAVIAVEHRSGPPPFDSAEATSLVFRKSSRYGNVSISYFDRKS
ncbi:MAG: 16S rRNA (guanine(966)-N(2))-methyltransferase RsmD [Thermoanaerobaculia bacterium]